jgi:hypothetical protein
MKAISVLNSILACSFALTLVMAQTRSFKRFGFVIALVWYSALASGFWLLCDREVLQPHAGIALSGAALLAHVVFLRRKRETMENRDENRDGTKTGTSMIGRSQV